MNKPSQNPTNNQTKSTLSSQSEQVIETQEFDLINTSLENWQTLLFQKYGVIFAFSKGQFNEQKVDGVKYSNAGMGMLIPTTNIDAFFSELERLHNQGRAHNLNKKGVNGIIEYEYFNHETQITGDVEMLIEHLEPYSEQFPNLFTPDKIRELSKQCLQKAIENDWF